MVFLINVFKHVIGKYGNGMQVKHEFSWKQILQEA